MALDSFTTEMDHSVEAVINGFFSRNHWIIATRLNDKHFLSEFPLIERITFNMINSNMINCSLTVIYSVVTTLVIHII